MKFTFEETFIKDIIVVTPHPFEDDRGFFMEVFNIPDFEKAGIPTKYVQMNHSRSMKNVVRGLHFQWDPPMGKIMRVTRGLAFLVAVDIRKNSPTLGKWYGNYFSEINKKQIWAPAGFARGICTMVDNTEVQYLITGEYNPINESEILWNDPDIGIVWPVENPTMSNKDKNAKTFKQWLDNPNSEKFKV